MNNMLMDSYGRVITSLRSLDTIVKIVTTATEFGVKKVKFSGGEPYYKNNIKQVMCKI